MYLNNETLILLSKFAAKAKKHIGLVELKKVISDQQYASKVLIKARLSDNKELAILTKIVSQELDMNLIELSAIESYISTLSANGASLDYIDSSKYYLIILADYLHGCLADGASYRQAVESMSLHAEAEERPLCIHVARDFYSYWINENQLIFGAQNPPTIHVLEHESIKISASELWNTIDAELYSDTETALLNLYTASLQEKGFLGDHIATRQKFAKIIIKALRDADSNAQGYRKAVDKTQHLFTRKDLKKFLFIVAREFHDFWQINSLETNSAISLAD